MHGHNKTDAKIADELKLKGFDFFQPSIYKIKSNTEGGKKKELINPLKGYFFVHDSYEHLQQFVTTSGVKLRFSLNVCNGNRNEPLIVKDRDMQNFMLVASAYDEHTEYIDPYEVNLKKGQHVRIIGGKFDGYVGTYMQVRRGQSRRIVVQIQGLVCITALVDPSYIEILD